MRAARLSSPRLQRALKVLKDGKPHTTRELMRKGNICAVNSVVAELREHGAKVICTQDVINGQRRFYYTMTKGPK